MNKSKRKSSPCFQPLGRVESCRLCGAVVPLGTLTRLYVAGKDLLACEGCAVAVVDFFADLVAADDDETGEPSFGISLPDR